MIQENNGEIAPGRNLPMRLYEFEFMLIPQLLKVLQQEAPDASLSSLQPFLLANLADKSFLLQTVSKLGYQPMFDTDDFKVEFKLTSGECFIIYTFPYPDTMPLAKYGVIVIGDSEASYYTLERSLAYDTGKIGWMLGKTADVHFNLGSVMDCETPDAFLYLLYTKGLIHNLETEPRDGASETGKGFWSKLKKLFGSKD